MTEKIIGNTSSIFKTIGLIIAGYLIPLAIAHGIDFHGQETQITQLLGAIIGLALSYIDMKYANSFFKKTITLEDYIQYGVTHFNMKPINNNNEEYTDLILNQEYTTNNEGA